MGLARWVAAGAGQPCKGRLSSSLSHAAGQGPGGHPRGGRRLQRARGLGLLGLATCHGATCPSAPANPPGTQWTGVGSGIQSWTRATPCAGLRGQGSRALPTRPAKATRPTTPRYGNMSSSRRMTIGRRSGAPTPRLRLWRTAWWRGGRQAQGQQRGKRGISCQSWGPSWPSVSRSGGPLGQGAPRGQWLRLGGSRCLAASARSRGCQLGQPGQGASQWWGSHP